jgi:hypothetical protein
VLLATDAVLNRGTDHSPGSVLSQCKLGSSGDESCADATCGSPSVINCTEPSRKGGDDSRILSHQTPVEQLEDVTDREASAEGNQRSEQCSNRNVECTVASAEANAAADDRSFSFEVGAPPNVSEKAHSPAWSPFPRFSPSQSVEVTLIIFIIVSII